MTVETHQLENGIRVIHKHDPSAVGHLALIIHTGSRDENPNEHGLAHFIEHAFFKGTQRRKAYHIINRLENAGGEINAYTTKEYTCIHSTFLKEDYHRSVELMFDIIFQSTFPEKELQKEKEVILDEINAYKDDPSELIFDDFEELLFPNIPLGRNILGTRKHLKSFQKQHIQDFIQRNYHTNQMVVSSIGNIKFKRLAQLVERYFGQIPTNKRINGRKKFDQYQPSQKNIKKNTHQAHGMIGNVTYGLYHPEKNSLQLLNNIIGGPGQNSRLNLSLRERSGLSYQVESHYVPYTDTGAFMVYFGTDKKNVEKSIAAIHREFKKLREKKLGILQLSQTKKQWLGQFAIAAENKEHYMISMGRTLLLYDRIFDFHEIRKKYESITAEEIRDIANVLLHPDNLSMLIYQ